jgi:hypothetical protein
LIERPGRQKQIHTTVEAKIWRSFRLTGYSHMTGDLRSRKGNSIAFSWTGPGTQPW